jgi:hypothetical protein
MTILFLNEKKHKYGVMDDETGEILIDGLNDGDHITVLDPATNQYIDDVIRIDPPVKKYFLERLQRLGRLQGIKCKLE